MSYVDTKEVEKLKEKILLMDNNQLIEMYDKEIKNIDIKTEAKNNSHSDFSYWGYIVEIETSKEKAKIIENELNNRLFSKNKDSLFNMNLKKIQEQDNYINQIFSNKKKIIEALEITKPSGYKKILDIIENIFKIER